MNGPHKKKVRVSFRKNRQKRSRTGDLTRQTHGNPEAVEDSRRDERISGKGELSRRRTIVTGKTSGDVDGAATACVDGRVLTAIGANLCRVQTASGLLLNCSIRRVVRTLSRDVRNAVVAGDRVRVLPTGGATGVIEAVAPRTSSLTRGSRRQAHMIVANIDQAVIVASAVDPPLKTPLIDRFLVSAEKGGLRGVVCINKVDRADAVALQPIVGVYARLGYDVVLASATQGIGIELLRAILRGRETVFAGQSGVGKSSLLNAIQPGLALGTGEVSGDTGKGRHTTRVATLFPLDFGGWVVDTPGIRQLQMWDVAPEEVEGYFIEFRPYVARCRFPNCSHTHESGCGVKGAVDRDFISRVRYAGYLRMVLGDD